MLCLVSTLCIASSAGAQTADDLFNPGAVRRLDLLVNTRDWEQLKAEFQINDYYPADMRWNGVAVRNVAVP